MESMKDRYQAAKKSGKLANLGVTFLKFDKPGRSILGRFVSNVLIEGREFAGQYFQYIFETDDGPIKCHMGGAFDQEYSEMLVSGQLYYIEFTGTDELGGNRQIKRYTVEAVVETADR